MWRGNRIMTCEENRRGQGQGLEGFERLVREGVVVVDLLQGRFVCRCYVFWNRICWGGRSLLVNCLDCYYWRIRKIEILFLIREDFIL